MAKVLQLDNVQDACAVVEQLASWKLALLYVACSRCVQSLTASTSRALPASSVFKAPGGRRTTRWTSPPSFCGLSTERAPHVAPARTEAVRKWLLRSSPTGRIVLAALSLKPQTASAYSESYPSSLLDAFTKYGLALLQKQLPRWLSLL